MQNIYLTSKKTKYPYVTIAMVLSNVCIFLASVFMNTVIYHIGALETYSVIIEGQYYRFISSMFLHGDINHLVNNMILLFFIGEIVEKYIGHIQYFILYFCSGILGGVASCIYELIRKEFYSSVGASGAVFGVIGSLLVLVIINKGKLEQITLKRLCFMLAFSLYYGMTSSNINNAAHFGGVLAGVIITLLMWLFYIVRTKVIKDFNN